MFVQQRMSSVFAFSTKGRICSMNQSDSNIFFSLVVHGQTKHAQVEDATDYEERSFNSNEASGLVFSV